MTEASRPRFRTGSANPSSPSASATSANLESAAIGKLPSTVQQALYLHFVHLRMTIMTRNGCRNIGCRRIPASLPNDDQRLGTALNEPFALVRALVARPLTSRARARAMSINSAGRPRRTRALRPCSCAPANRIQTVCVEV